MRTHRARALVALLVSLVGSSVGFPARAAIVGVLEAPTGYASQVSNIQGWAYTDTPGAELIQPFDVRIDGVKVQQVPCCSDRGDVRGNDPAIPLQTGFSGVINWTREALEADGPVVLSVVVRDTEGGELVLEETLDLFAMTSFPFSRGVAFAGQAAAGDLDSRCTLANVPNPLGDEVAEISCSGLTATNADGSLTEACEGEVRFTWDIASQGFRQSSSCEVPPRWTDHGDGTATDNETGLMWELKTGDLEDVPISCGAIDHPRCADLHHVRNYYTWSEFTPSRPDGTAFTRFLAGLNGGESADGITSEGCFAGYCDWRLPTLEELLAVAVPCEEGSCGSIPGETAPWLYWSSTSDGTGKYAWYVHFEFGDANTHLKEATWAVRAVRGTARKQAGESSE